MAIFHLDFKIVKRSEGNLPLRKLPIMLVAESQMKERVIRMIIADVQIYTGISY